MRRDRIVVVAAGICLAVLAGAGAYGQSQSQNPGKIKVIKPKAAPAPTPDESSEPDKVLYERAMTDLQHKRYEEERLSLETLINTYPDSEYLDKAKLAVADSFYTEGGDSNMTQAIGEYKSFIVFFPQDDKAPYAQMQIGMAHYKMMAKPDRDDSESLNAEAELQAFLVKYPDSKLAPQAEQKLRDVQETIADGQFRVARFYYLRPDYRAAAARLTEITQRYPLYSQSDEALWMLGNVYAMARKVSRNEDDKNHWADLQGKVLDRIVVNYPLSLRAAQAKTQLKAMGMAIPPADPAAVARMKKQQEYMRAHRQNSMMAASKGLLRSGPDFSMAAQSGMPNLEPPADSISAKDILSPTSTGPSFNLAATSVAGGGSGGDGAVLPVTSVGDAPSDSGAASDTGNGGTNVTDTNITVGAPITSSATDASAPSNTPSAGSSNDPVGQVDAPTTTSSTTGTSATTDNSAAQAANPPTAAPPVTNNESSSKKKKGLGKLNPF
jgi:outer membrane protein assembly factor BamD